MKLGRRPADGDTWCCKPGVGRGRRQKVKGEMKLGRRPLRVGVYSDGKGGFKDARRNTNKIVLKMLF